MSLNVGRLLRFRRDERGLAAIEFALIGPILIFLLFGSIQIFELIKTKQNAEKATFTISDIISRQTSVNAAFLDQMSLVFARLVSGAATNKQIRVSSITKAAGKLSVAWSYPVAPMVELVTAKIPLSVIPDIADGDSVILIETVAPHDSIISMVPIVGTTFTHLAVTRPRFVSAIVRN